VSRPATRLVGIHPGALGDVILFGHLLAHLRTPDTHVALAAAGEKARLLASLGVIDEPMDLNALPLHELFADQPVDTSALAERFAGSTRLISCFAYGNLPVQQRLTSACGASQADYLPVRPDRDDRRHLLTVWADQLRLQPPRPMALRKWAVPAKLQVAAAGRLRAHGVDPAKPFIAMHVGSGSPGKCWPVGRFVRLAGGLAVPTVFLVGPVERERLAVEATDSLRGAGVLLDGLPLADLAGVLAAAVAYVGNDSGPTHLAAAVGTPVVALFGRSDPLQFAPRTHPGGAVEVVRHESLSALPVALVDRAVRRALAWVANAT